MARYLQSNFVIMSLLRKILVLAAILLSGLSLRAQTDGYDVFIPISKYISQGNSDNLSAWFADNLEVSILANANDCSRNQAKQILKSFFSSHTPRSFSINHTASRGNMKYALGNLNAGGLRTYNHAFAFVQACSLNLLQFILKMLLEFCVHGSYFD